MEDYVQLRFARSLSITEQFLSVSKRLSLKNGTVQEMVERLVLPGIMHKRSSVCYAFHALHPFLFCEGIRFFSSIR